MEVLGEGGVLVSLLGCMGWVYKRILGGLGGSSVITPDLKWVMVPRFWLDLWRGDMALKDAFLISYGIARSN